VLAQGETLADLRSRFPRAGTLVWIGARPARGAPVADLAQAELVAGRGIDGDHRARRGGGSRQVTLLQAEHLGVIAALAGLERVEPGALRRNLVVRGINLLALKGMRFRIGDAVLEGTGACHPCSRMEQALGPGGYNAVRNHGGITAVVIAGGAIVCGDPVQALAPVS
jgi:MOSC domain-containing protein YiiM